MRCGLCCSSVYAPGFYHSKTGVLKCGHAGVDSGYRAVFSGLSGLYSLVIVSPPSNGTGML